MPNLVLASLSPRRKELLSTLNIPFIVHASDEEEVFHEELPFEQRLLDVAYQKASHVLPLYPGDVIIGCDTTCVLDGRIIGKPADYEDAFRMMKDFSNKKHEVYSALCILDKDKVIKKLCVSNVYFKDLNDDDIHEYLAFNEWQDKAGGYGIQGYGSMLIDHY